MINSITGALARKRSALGEKEKGFTLIELLVVVIIIGILAAIAIPIFLGQQASARDSAVKSDITNAKVAVVADMVKNNGAVPAALPTADFTSSVTSNLALKVPSTGGFCIDGHDETNGATVTTTFHATDLLGVTAGACP